MVIIIVIIMKIFIGLLQRSKENAYYKYSKKWYTRIIIIYIIGIIGNPQPGLAESRQGRTGLVGQSLNRTQLFYCFVFFFQVCTNYCFQSAQLLFLFVPSHSSYIFCISGDGNNNRACCYRTAIIEENTECFCVYQRVCNSTYS